MKQISAIILFLLVVTVSCEDQYLSTQPSHLVVEGWIDDGGYPTVIVSRSLQISEEYTGLDELSDYIVKWAKVTVYCGEDSVILTGKYDSGYFPPYVYTTGRMMGEKGKTYSVKVEYRDMTATAVTTIPSTGPDVRRFDMEKCTDSDSLYKISVLFADDKEERNYYQLFSRVGAANKQYSASYLGSLDDAVLGDTTETVIYRGHSLSSTEEYTSYFRSGDSVSVKIAAIDQASYNFWDDYTKMLSLSVNPFMSPQRTIRSNIVNGFGCWYGMNSVQANFVIPDK